MLRAYIPGDREEYIQMVTHEDVLRFAGGALSKDRASELFDRFLNGQFPYEIWAVLDRLSGKYMGHIFFSNLDEARDADPPGPELGFALLPPVWGRGYATEATKRVLRYAFGNGGYSRVYATVDLDNKASIRVIEKLSMKRIRMCEDEQGAYWLFAIDAI